MHRGEIDQEHNRLFLRWIDSLNLTGIDQLQTEVSLLPPKLQPGFDCIGDIANMRRVVRIGAKVAVRIEHRSRWTAGRLRRAIQRSTWIPRRRHWSR